MKLCLIASILLLAPIVSAQQPPLAKAIYSDGFMITENYDTRLYFQRNESFLTFSLSNLFKLTRTRRMVLHDANVIQNEKSFVVEWVVGPGTHRVAKTEQFCESASSSELRPLIAQCTGLVRLRALSAEETNQLAAIKKEAEETGHTFTVLYNEGSVISKTVQIDKLAILAIKRDPLMIEVKRQPHVWATVTLKNVTGKRFMIEGPVEHNNCYRTPVVGLKVSYCIGQVQIVKPPATGSNGRNKPGETGPEKPANPTKPENPAKPANPAKPSLDDLSPEELKQLLKDILGRL